MGGLRWGGSPRALDFGTFQTASQNLSREEENQDMTNYDSSFVNLVLHKRFWFAVRGTRVFDFPAGPSLMQGLITTQEKMLFLFYGKTNNNK